MAEVYAQVNLDLTALIAKESATRLEHVTRVARVLLDPTHRQVLLDAARHGMTPTICYRDVVRGQSRPTAWSFLASCRPSWAGATWLDIIDLIELGASQAFRMYATTDALPAQFSLFGSDRVLLQSPTERPALEKFVWYVISRDLSESLRTVHDTFLTTAHAIDSASFVSMRKWLADGDLYRWVQSVTEAGGTVAFTEPEEVADWRLEMLGIWERSGDKHDRRVLTTFGRQWLEGRVDGPADR